MPKLLTHSTLRDDGSAVPRNRVLLLTLTMTSSLGMVASTIYVPSLPAIAAALETSISRVQLTFAGYLLAFAASMLVLGPLSDRYGRRRTIICGLALSADGKRLASSDRDGTFKVWDLETAKELNSISLGNGFGGITCLALSHDGQRLAFWG